MKGLFKFFDLNVFPGNFVRTSSLSNAMYLKTDETFCMSLVDCFIDQGLNVLPIDPGLNFWAFGDNAELIPLTVFEVFVRLEPFRRREPTTTSSFTIDVTSFCTFSTTGFDFYLRSVHPAEFGFASFRDFLGLTANLNPTIEFIGYLYFKFQFEVTIKFLSAKETVGATFVGFACDGIPINLVSGRAIFLDPIVEVFTVK